MWHREAKKLQKAPHNDTRHEPIQAKKFFGLVEKVLAIERVLNHDLADHTFQPTLSVTVTESSTANHGISWNAKASHSSSIEIGGDIFGGKGTYDFGFEHGYGSQHDWGTSTSSQVTISKTPEVTLEGKYKTLFVVGN